MPLLLVENRCESLSFLGGLVFAVQNRSFEAELCKKRERSAVISNLLAACSFSLHLLLMFVFDRIAAVGRSRFPEYSYPEKFEIFISSYR